MTRALHKKHNQSAKKLRAVTKGFWGRRKNCYRIMKVAAIRANKNRRVSRKESLRNRRCYENIQINNWARKNIEHKMTYSSLMSTLRRDGALVHRGLMVRAMRYISAQQYLHFYSRWDEKEEARNQ